MQDEIGARFERSGKADVGINDLDGAGHVGPHDPSQDFGEQLRVFANGEKDDFVRRAGH